MIISELKVLESNAGWYIGRTYTDMQEVFDLPYSRESNYFETKREALDSLFHDFFSNPKIRFFGWCEGEIEVGSFFK